LEKEKSKDVRIIIQEIKWFVENHKNTIICLFATSFLRKLRNSKFDRSPIVVGMDVIVLLPVGHWEKKKLKDVRIVI